MKRSSKDFVDEVARSEWKMLDTLYTNFQGGASLSELCGRLEDQKPQAIRVFLQRLVDKGLVERQTFHGIPIYRPIKAKRSAFRSMLKGMFSIFSATGTEILHDLVAFGFISRDDIERAAAELPPQPKEGSPKKDLL